MHFSTIVALFAAAAIAVPAPGRGYWRGRHHKTTPKTTTAGNQCSETQEAACCNSADDTPSLAGNCALSFLGGACTGSVQCCDVGGDGLLISLNLCVPIQV